MSCSTAPGSEAMEVGLPTADIIAFPVRPKPAVPRPEDRLARALETLNAALAEQRVAVTAWREALAHLKSTTTGLGDSLQNYQSNLGLLSDRVSGLNAQARSLERWADSVIIE